MEETNAVGNSADFHEIVSGDGFNGVDATRIVNVAGMIVNAAETRSIIVRTSLHIVVLILEFAVKAAG